MTDYSSTLGISIPDDFNHIFQHAYGKYLETVLKSIDDATIVAINNYVRLQSRELPLEIPDVDESGFTLNLENYINIDMAVLNQAILDLITNDYTTGGSVPTAIPNITSHGIAYPIVIDLINASPATYVTLKDAEPTGLIVSPTRANVGTILSTLQLSPSDFLY